MRASVIVAILAGILLAAAPDASRIAPFLGGPGGILSLTRDSFAEIFSLVGEAALNPDFNLTREQLERIQTIRSQVKAERDKWFKEHAEDFRKAGEEFRKAREAGDREKFRDIFQQRAQILQTIPPTGNAAEKIKAVLTPDQLKLLDAYTAQKRAEEDQLQQAVWEFYGGGLRPATRPISP